MRVAHKAVAAATAAGIALGTAVLAPGVASAASYNGACGSGYGVVNHRDLTGGTVYLTYNNGTGLNCVVTVRNSPGAKLWMNARIARSDDIVWTQDPGYFGTYAGPVYRSAAGVCVDWGGDIDTATVTASGTNCG
ncbi:hypothetical protein [Actinokineospora inagensis]|uniref:hypothetical protein n=1 Tax=Actinokineospora inagensis TaxID=103730 RepID=UPI000687F34F|nr:hypothetical protein [Actinokineospora inagensis]